MGDDLKMLSINMLIYNSVLRGNKTTFFCIGQVFCCCSTPAGEKYVLHRQTRLDPIATRPRSAEVPWRKGANCLSGGRMMNGKSRVIH